MVGLFLVVLLIGLAPSWSCPPAELPLGRGEPGETVRRPGAGLATGSLAVAGATPFAPRARRCQSKCRGLRGERRRTRSPEAAM